MSDVLQVKVGDKLAVDRNFGLGVDLIKVVKILPSGRIQAGRYTLNPDLKIRGAAKWGPYRAYIPTAEDLEKVARQENLQFITLDRIAKLSSESIQKIVDIIRGDVQ